MFSDSCVLRNRQIRFSENVGNESRIVSFDKLKNHENEKSPKSTKTMYNHDDWENERNAKVERQKRKKKKKWKSDCVAFSNCSKKNYMLWNQKHFFFHSLSLSFANVSSILHLSLGPSPHYVVIFHHFRHLYERPSHMFGPELCFYFNLFFSRCNLTWWISLQPLP